jgi:hypothetical protein
LNIIIYEELLMVWIFWDSYESVKESVKDNVGLCPQERNHSWRSRERSEYQPDLISIHL